jgi:N-acetylglutamate synthase-like GNAT family acetyltransferase
MTKKELKEQIEDGVKFSCYIENNKVVGVVGIQDKTDVNLIRHAYVMTSERKKGIGTILINELLNSSNKPILIGTWKAAHWAISFYERCGFFIVTEEEKNILLRKYWNIPDRQVETSIVLADENYKQI